MEIIRGKQTSLMDAAALAERIQGYGTIHIDIGTGDGRYVQHMAQAHPKDFVIGIDACRENLVEVSRRTRDNTLFVIANAEALPCELDGLAAHITINFPWGSLLEGLLAEEAGLITGLRLMARTEATIDVRLNGGALAEVGWDLEAGTERVQAMLSANGFKMRNPQAMLVSELKAFPTTWAKRIAFGRDPRGVALRGVMERAIVVEVEFGEYRYRQAVDGILAVPT
nr:Putative methyltransferase [uncultured bacterium]